VDDDSTPAPQSARATTPRRRGGWGWTLVKCAIAVVVSALAGGVALFVLLHGLLDRLPGWLPRSWMRWLFEWVLRHVWFVGPAIGVLLGLVVSTVIIVVDAKRGRLSRLP
jgi:hypothetical protein